MTQIWDKLLRRNSWETFCSYQLLDLTSVWKVAEVAGIVPKLPKTSLWNISDYLQIHKGISHTAIGDCVSTLNCLKILVDRMKR